MTIQVSSKRRCDFAQEKVDGVALFVDGAIEVHPLTTNLDISLIYAPGVADRPRITAPALLKFRDIPLHPSQNGRMGQGDAALGHHLDEIAGAELKRQIPPDAQHNDFLVKVAPFEEILCRGRFRHPSRYRKTPSVSTVCTRTLERMSLDGHTSGKIFYGILKARIARVQTKTVRVSRAIEIFGDG